MKMICSVLSRVAYSGKSSKNEENQTKTFQFNADSHRKVVVTKQKNIYIYM